MGRIVDLIEAIEAAGWIVDSIEDESCVVRCPKQGCAMRMRVRQGSDVPRRSREADDFGMEVTDWTHFRKYLRERRRKWKLSIKDVEEKAGMADGHLLKMEKNNPARTPQFSTIKLWADTLGIGIYVMPKGKSPDHLKRAVDEAEKAGLVTKRTDMFRKHQLRAYRPETKQRLRRF